VRFEVCGLLCRDPCSLVDKQSTYYTALLPILDNAQKFLTMVTQNTVIQQL